MSYPWYDIYSSMISRLSKQGATRIADIDQTPTGPPPHLAIVLEAPAKDECDAYLLGDNVQTHGTVAVGPTGVMLEAAFHFAGFPRNRCYMTNVFPFELPDDYKISVSDVDAVSSYVRDKLKNFPIVLCLGRPALRVFSDTSEGIIDICGSIIEIGDQKIIPSIHPSYALKAFVGQDDQGDESVFWYLVLAIRTAASLLRGEYPFKNSRDLKVNVLRSRGEVRSWLEQIPKDTEIAFDLEGTSTNPYLTGIPSCASMCSDNYMPVVVPLAPWFPGIEISFIDLLRIMEDMDHVDLDMHNLLYDYSVMTRFGYKGKPPKVDTMYLTHTGIEFIPKGLKFLTAFFCEIEPYAFPFAKLAGFYQGGQYADYEYWLLRLLRYAGIDGKGTRILRDKLPTIFGKDWDRIRGIYFEYVHPLLLDLHRTSANGSILNQQLLQNVRESLKAIRKQAECDFKAYFPGIENLKSPKELSKAFMPLQYQYPNILRVSPKSKQLSLAKSVLQALEENGVQSAKPLLLYRKVSKQLSTYVDAYPQYLDSEGLIHTQFGLTKTSRLRSSDPALQTLPRKSIILSLFTADFGLPPYNYVLLKADFSAAEARYLAFLCGLLAMLDPTVDVHKLTATHFFEIALELVTPDMRQATKNLTFGIIYGASVKRIAMLIYGDVSPENIAKADQLLKKFFLRFPEISRFMGDREGDVRMKGYVEMPQGLRRHFPVECIIAGLCDPNKKLPWGRLGKQLGRQLMSKAIREGYNFIPQGGVAYLTNTSHIRLNQNMDIHFDNHPFKPLLNMQIHDALVNKLHKSVFCNAAELIRKTMVDKIMGDVIMPVDLSMGWDLLNQTKIVSAEKSIYPINWDSVIENMMKRPDDMTDDQWKVRCDLLQFVRESRSYISD